ncbi:HU family DNA-binding protein, partial [Streptomyces sp. NPDC057654]|uniref:HU family DNA-binding protein n=1 Tax=Streptomyces sp. NPDC057654 TaxID=3346196 RepID=UPI0036AC488A
MNKAALIKAVTPRVGSKRQATDAVDAVLDTIVRAVAAGEAVSVTGFGTLVPKARPARVVRNPQNGEQIKRASSRVVRFRPGTRFSDLVSGRRPMPAIGNCIQKDPKTPR